MGLSIREILDSEFFKDCKIIAGHSGLDNQIQGVAILDAPDGFKWTEGKELVVSSGYVFHQNPELFETYIQSDLFKKISGMVIKIDRYLKTVPDHIIKACDELNIPLINISSKPSWMDVINQLNVIVMNKNINRFKIGSINPRSFSDLSYRVRKINKILTQIENEMNFPAMLYDLSSEKAYYSSPEFIRLSDGLELEDFWNPSFHNTQEILCDNLKMIRYRFYDDKYERPYSWITIPITVEGRVNAYFVVVEATGLIDYFDQFSIRIGFLLLQSLYEQMLVAQNIGDIGFEKFVLDSINRNMPSVDVMTKRAYELSIDVNCNYYFLLLKQINPTIKLGSYKEILRSAVKNTNQIEARMSLLDENDCLIVFVNDDRVQEKQTLELIKEYADNLIKRLQKKIKGIKLIFGFSDIAESIYEIERNYQRCTQAINIGRLLFKEKNFITYSELGFFAWMNIKEDELDIMLKDIDHLLHSEEYKEHVTVLKAYLKSKMNYSLTAKRLFMHINTVRKKIDEINDLIKIDLENPMNRLKIEVLLELFK
ncbi:PucR family transcriptional regulator [Brassicibacter mesophilus]|uniref:PucR family transcriptional regulator n=1 Tax=Brassicibacter mesophilus TaxID=745119 RepID=UPI003D243F01